MVQNTSPTVMLAVAVGPEPASLDVIGPLVKVFQPVSVAVMLNMTAHVAEAARLPPEKLMLGLPGAAVTVPPVQEVLPTLAIESPAGSVSVNAIPVNEVVLFEFVMVYVRLVVPLIGIAAAPKALVMFSAMAMLILALAGSPLPASLEVTALVVLVTEPAAVLVTLTLKVHDVLGFRIAADRPMLVPPAVALILPPPQEPVRPLPGLETFSPAGNESVKPTPLSEMELAFMIVKLTVVLPFRGNVETANAVVMVGGPITLTLAVLLVVPGPLSVAEMIPVVFD